MFLIAMESVVVDKDNWDQDYRNSFDVVFTWDANLPDNRNCKPRLERFYWPNKINDYSNYPGFEDRKKLCVMVAGNKWKPHPNELYSERVRAIKWFSRNHPEDFDLYGPDWELGPVKKMRRIMQNGVRYLSGKPLRFFSWGRLPCYRGHVASKKDLFKNYRFCLCYENAKDIPGYITEKIFDCFLGGVVPVYLGWSGISSLVPKETFIDRRHFSDYREIYSFLKNIGPEDYNRYLLEAEGFLKSDRAVKFDGWSFVETVLRGIGD